MPLTMPPMPCSRTPKCSVRPYGPPGHSSVVRSAGRKLGSPFIVVLFEPARSADPPHSSGTWEASALSTSADAALVAFEPASKTGRVRSSGSFLASTRSSSFTPSGLACCHAANSSSQAARSALPRSAS